jgi:hypothetical protein
MSLKVASFDVGTRNLAWVLLEVQLPDVHDKNRHKELVDKQTKPMDGFFAPWHNCRIHEWEVIDVLVDNDDTETTNSNLITLSKWIPLIHDTLRKRCHLLEDVDVVLIESQPNFGREKIKMISMVINSFFTQHFFGHPNQPIVSFASAQIKLQVHVDPRNFYQVTIKPRQQRQEKQKSKQNKLSNFFDTPPGSTAVVPPAIPPTSRNKKSTKTKNTKADRYKARKQEAIQLAGLVLQHIQVPNHLLDRFCKSRKQDDFSDCLLQGIGYLQRSPPRRKP